MAKKSAKKDKVMEPAAESKCLCQNCKFHVNKPSTCRHLHKYVARKSTCNEWKGNK